MSDDTYNCWRELVDIPYPYHLRKRKMSLFLVRSVEVLGGYESKGPVKRQTENE